MLSPRGLASLLVALVLLTAGCATHPRPAPPPDLPTSMPSEVEAGRVRPGAGEAVPHPASAPAARVPPAAVVGAQGASRIVYRVQLLATGDADVAERRAAELRRIFAEPVRVDVEDGLFKVRAGDFTDRAAAEALQRQAIALGIPDAFVTEANERAR